MKKIVQILFVFFLFSAYISTLHNVYAIEPYVGNECSTAISKNLINGEETIIESPSTNNLSLNVEDTTQHHTEPFIPSTLPSVTSIIGEDDRSDVLATQAFPASTICFLEVTFPTKTTYTTGTMIYNDLVLTAGHCVYDYQNHQWATDIKVTPAKFSGLEPYGYVYAAEMITSNAFVNDTDLRGDWGLIRLQSNLGNQTGWCGISITDDYTSLNGLDVGIMGYPENNLSVMQKGRGTILSSTFNLLYYNVDTTVGQSGSGIFKGDFADGYVIGVHSGGEDSTRNRGVRITPGIFSTIESYMD